MSRRSERIDKIVDDVLGKTEKHDINASALLKRLWRQYMVPDRKPIILALFISLLWGGLPLLFPLLTRFMVDEVLMVEKGVPPEELPHHIRLVFVVLGLSILIRTMELGSEWARSRLILRAGRKVIYRIRKSLMEKLQRLHIGYYERTPTGVILSRVMDDVNVIREWISRHSMAMAGGVAKVLVGLLLMLCIHWKMALMFFVSLPLFTWSFMKIRPVLRRAHSTLRRMNALMYARATERISAIEVVKAFAREKSEEAAFCSLQFNHYRVTGRLIVRRLLLVTCTGTITAVTGGLVIWTGALAVRNGTMSLGNLMAFHLAAMFTFMPMNQLVGFMTELEHVFVILHRVFNVLDEKWQEASGDLHLSGGSGTIALENVEFTYPGQGEPSLKDVSFEVEPGQKVALMGPSGSGKSTVFLLLLRFYDPQKGKVSVNKIDLSEADPASVRRHVRLVLQEPIVFSGTFMENVTYGNPDAKKDQVARVCERAELDEFIEELPQKYGTEIGENGVTLSGGQKQRLALATALLTDPEVLLLDDTTSSLDAETETKIRATLNKVLEGRSSLIITQRIMTARDCDRIIVLEDGKVVQAGTHAELVEQDGFYRRICEQQDCL